MAATEKPPVEFRSLHSRYTGHGTLTRAPRPDEFVVCFDDQFKDGFRRKDWAVWSAESGDVAWTWREPEGFRDPGADGSTFFRPAASPDGRRFAAAFVRRTGKPADEPEYGVRVFRTDGTPVAKLVGPEDRVIRIAWADDARLVSVGEDGMARVWRLDDRAPGGGTEVAAFDGHLIRRGRHWLACDVGCVAVSPDGRTAATGDAVGNVLLWDAGTGKLVHRLRKVIHDEVIHDEVNDDEVNDVRFFPDGSKVAICTAAGQVEVYDAATGLLVCGSSFLGTPGVLPPRALVSKSHPAALGLDVSRSGRFVAYDVHSLVGVRDYNLVRVLDVRTGKIVGELSDAGLEVDGIKFNEFFERPAGEQYRERARLGFGSPHFIENDGGILIPTGHKRVAVWHPSLPE